MGAGFAILYQGRQLLKRLVSAVGMHRRDGTRVAGVDAFDKLPCLIPAQLGKEYAVGLHAQAGCQCLLGANLGAALIFTRVEQMNLVRVLVQKNLMHVLNGDQPFMHGNASCQAFGDRGLPRSRLADDQDENC